jgi:hypothetical protein
MYSMREDRSVLVQIADAIVQSVILGLIDWTGCWQTDDGLLVRCLITKSEDRLKVNDLIAERHTQGVGFSLEISQSKEVGFG